MGWVTDNRHRIDCLVIQHSPDQAAIFERLRQLGIFLPAIAIDPADQSHPSQPSYHEAVKQVTAEQIDQLEPQVTRAIEDFIQLPAQAGSLAGSIAAAPDSPIFLLSLQQQRLIEKLQERLGYLGVYYKRSPQNFYRNMTSEERHEFLTQLRHDYRRIILAYFTEPHSPEKDLNQQIDDFVNLAFFADISVSKIVEIHMELMDSFSKQLHLEGRNEDVLLDYRLTLIDVLAHLCEMYRRSIPK